MLIGVLSEYLLRRRSDIDLIMMDNWLTADKQPEACRATGDVHANHTDARRVMEHRRQAQQRARMFPGRANIIKANSVEAAKRVPNGSLDLVFLDADHSYDGVKADLAAWVPKIKPGDWIGGHDYSNGEPGYAFPAFDRAVNEWASARGLVGRDRFEFYMVGDGMNVLTSVERKLVAPLVGNTMLEFGNKKNAMGTYKDCFIAHGFEHVSVDLNGKDGTLERDLQVPLSLGRFDIVTNFGTTEHVAEQEPAWRNAMESTGQVFVSTTPAPGYWPTQTAKRLA
ncbi:class I SAM-dependent methyltransferase [Mesorhizobium sp.]|uniref:class I SAM-dependent methyltransferase n=1 Tax=Mesorhizobium sp. TaxID=1871066 RepID=UPI000FE490B9|nr:class I SAM-dependent methyltransferase [Mesorhizobium sp.]RWH78079.1 MAG: class I SAM-dependent methyltransferase [Mesorhizobium sp.]